MENNLLREEKYNVQSLDEGQVAQMLTDMHKSTTWRKIAKIYNIPAGTLDRYSKGGQIINPEHRAIFGLPPIVKITACPSCGKVHLSKHRIRKPKEDPEKEYQKLLDRTSRGVKRLLEMSECSLFDLLTTIEGKVNG